MGDSRQFDPQKAHAHRRRAASDASRADATHPLLGLQRTIGNFQVQRLLAQREAAEEEEEIQAQRETDEEEEIQTQREMDEEEEIQTKREVGAEGGTLSPEAAGNLEGLRGGGAPLEAGLRTSMEAAMGTSFADVRVHTSGEADALNRSMGARAFTSGSDVMLRSDQDAADTRLMAHELTHVVQQRTMSNAGGAGQDGPQVRPAGDTYEQDADATAERLHRDGLV
jgi:hypothetical protein